MRREDLKKSQQTTSKLVLIPVPSKKRFQVLCFKIANFLFTSREEERRRMRRRKRKRKKIKKKWWIVGLFVR
jgi:hypothetical protein